ncbi:protein Jumonji [Contarinia nasturtii]|uniref:protein Jumonji n=1 Tax=Contarinia nasturtii TaxID=265458 RepID=UPI0012D43FFF|nr:protein Jumonji [Contarinia nasturtii]
MVISKVGKRKRNPPPVKETRPVQEQPKRPKVQAQRKFAQACGGGSASSTVPSSLLANQSAQNGSAKPEGVSHDPPQELLPNRRPNTEDFLTFLCFRGTSVLPSHLDFFNTNKNSDPKQAKPKTENTATSCSSKDVKQEDKRPEVKNEKIDVAKDVKTDADAPKFIPFAVRKRAETVVAGSRKQTVQALKKKYQDQRIAKNKAQCKTRSSTAKETEVIKAPKLKQNDVDKTSNENPARGRNKRKLRGNIGNDQSDEEAVTIKPQKTAKVTNGRPNKVGDTNKGQKIATRTTKSIGSIPPKLDEKEKEEEMEESTRTTRQRSYSLPKSEAKPLKTVEKSAIQQDTITPKGNKSKNVKNKRANETVEGEFSSDDDLPLVEKKKGKATHQEKTKRNLKRISNRRNQSGESIEIDKSVDRKSVSSSEPASKRKTPSGNKKVAQNKSASNEPVQVKSTCSEKSENESQHESKKDTKAVKRKRRNEFTDLSQTDQSENETKTGRPMRKTKEAAAIYMELIGQKLNLSDFDDDLSVDSFPELPNVKKTEQMENDMKANLGKEKRELTSTPKRGRPKREEASSLPDEKHEPPQKSIENGQKDEKRKTSEPIAETGGKAKLEKSFSDSDDEPLATKFERKSKTPKDKTNPKKIVVTPTNKDLNQENRSENKRDTSFKSADNSFECKPLETTAQNTILAQNSSMTTPGKNNISTTTEPTTKTKNTSSPPKSIDLNETEFKMPAESVKQLLSPPINVSPIKMASIRGNARDKTAEAFNNNLLQASSSGKTTAQNISAILADLMPSKEESGKIFGIASVTLAQSSGPIDTKCTLGKCGSIHKPSLGPGVPTESYLGDQMSNKDRRKAKVNMTHEQIEKWLSECSMTAVPFVNDSLDDEIDLTIPPKPINYLSTPSPKRESDHARDEVPSLTKVRTQTPKEGKSVQVRQTTPVKGKMNLLPKGECSAKTAFAKKEDQFTANQSKPIVANKDNVTVTEKSMASKKSASANQNTNANANVDESKGECIKPISAVKTQTSPNKPNVKGVTVTPDKKPIYNRRTPVYNTKKSDQGIVKSPPVVNTFCAFSPENEASVYSFDKEEDTIHASIPFRRHSRRGSTHSKNNENDTSIKTTNITPISKPSPKDQQTKKQQLSLSLCLDDANRSAATVVATTKQNANDKVKKLSLNESDLVKAMAASDNDGRDSDSEGHTFYIPLQCMGNSSVGNSSDQLIQGVAVKLGTEGPEGPNQKVIMHAKLVTKSQMGANATPIPEGMGMANIHEIVKNLIANKEMASTKSVPIGTVQPRLKVNDLTKPSTSTLPTEIVLSNQPSASNLTRHNSNQSLFSQKTKSTKRPKNEQTIQPSNNTAFPRYDDPAQMVEAPVFRPTEKEFQDPIEFINRITPIAARFGLCRIIPPSTFKPECKISDDMRFTAYNQYVHKMLHRWGPSVKEFSAIKKYLATQCITLNQPPLIGGMEVDLPRLYHTVQELGGLKEVIEKKKWARVAEEMCIPKSAQDRVTKLDDIYCKYLLPYDTLSPSERQKLFESVEADWAKSEAKARRNADRSALSESNSNENSDFEEQSDEDDNESGDSGSMECIVKGKSTALSAFFRVARNTMALWFRNTEPATSEVETEFWRHVAVRDSHVCVHSGSIDSSGWGYGFPTPGPKTKNSTCSKHPWNLKVLTNNHNSILRSIGPITGVTVPTLHVGMLFSACCWYRDPHGLPWIEYLHTGGSKIWYSVPNEQSANFRTAFTSLVPTLSNKTVWLPCDTAMVPPHMLTDRGVSLCRTEQEPGQFVVVFPRAYTSNICTGYSISESVYFAPMSWLETAKEDFKDIHDSCEPAMFSLEQLLFSVASDVRTNVDILETVLPMLKEVYEREIKERSEIQASGVNQTEKIVLKPKKPQAEENECDICRANVYISWIRCDDDSIYCLHHAVKYLKNNRIQAKQCKLLFMYKKEEIEDLINKVNEKINQHKKKIENKK